MEWLTRLFLPTVMEYNAPATGTKYKDIAEAMGVDTTGMDQEAYRKAAVDAVKKLSQDVGIPADLKEIVKVEDLDFYHNQHMMTLAALVIHEKLALLKLKNYINLYYNKY